MSPDFVVFADELDIGQVSGFERILVKYGRFNLVTFTNLADNSVGQREQKFEQWGLLLIRFYLVVS